MAKSAAKLATKLATEASARRGKGFYRPLGWGVLRAPLLP